MWGCPVFLLVNLKRWLNITAQAQGDSRLLFGFGITIFAISIGVITGFPIGITSVGLTILDDTGTAIVAKGLAKASVALSFTGINAEIDVANAQLLIAKVHELQLVESSGIKASLNNGVV